MKNLTPIADAASPEILLFLARSGNMAALDALNLKIRLCEEALSLESFRLVLGDGKWTRMFNRVRDLGVETGKIQPIGKTDRAKEADWAELIHSVYGAS